MISKKISIILKCLIVMLILSSSFQFNWSVKADEPNTTHYQDKGITLNGEMDPAAKRYSGAFTHKYTKDGVEKSWEWTAPANGVLKKGSEVTSGSDNPPGLNANTDYIFYRHMVPAPIFKVDFTLLHGWYGSWAYLIIDASTAQIKAVAYINAEQNDGPVNDPENFINVNLSDISNTSSSCSSVPSDLLNTDDLKSQCQDALGYLFWLKGHWLGQKINTLPVTEPITHDTNVSLKFKIADQIQKQIDDEGDTKFPSPVKVGNTGKTATTVGEYWSIVKENLIVECWYAPASNLGHDYVTSKKISDGKITLPANSSKLGDYLFTISILPADESHFLKLDGYQPGTVYGGSANSPMHNFEQIQGKIQEWLGFESGNRVSWNALDPAGTKSWIFGQQNLSLQKDSSGNLPAADQAVEVTIDTTVTNLAAGSADNACGATTLMNLFSGGIEKIFISSMCNFGLMLHEFFQSLLSYGVDQFTGIVGVRDY